ncbi:hypothetical protein CRE_30069 [Caenorhabditis remanei]|uniref:HAT C-terminal dimerisation domain-containing protein n=1 Tax=Caenorhabditis remanei TaxID=31234 RepID=E3MYI0_CAERE|nr:hypothetical protein CRE_30069 [Caenorhabditis remanei]
MESVEMKSESSIPLNAKEKSRVLIPKKRNSKWLEELIQKGNIEISPYVKNGTATLVLDFGKHVNDFLSSFVSYISIDEHGEPFLKILPYSFTPMFDVKTAINVKDLLVQSGSKFGLMEHEVLSMHIVSDGASNLSSMGKRFFADWAICACHAIQKMSEKVLSPNVKNTFMYSSDELKKLNECSLLMGKCAKLALAVHKNKKLLHLSRLPTTYVETRWQSCINCAKDILSLLPFLKHSSVCMISEAAKEIEEEIVTLNPIVKTLEQFEPLLAFFEVRSSFQSTVTFHLYLPMIQAMHNTFSQIEKETDDTTTRIINKSARIVTGEYLEKKISHLHLKATLLTPRLKKMSKMTQSHQQLVIKTMEILLKTTVFIQALDVLKSDIAKRVSLSSPPPAQSSEQLKKQPNKFSFYDDITTSDEVDEFDAYMKERVTESTPECPLKYWFSKKDDFPLMSKIAFNVFSTLSSETVCERAFSAVRRVVRDDRQRLNPELIENIMIGFFYSNNYK